MARELVNLYLYAMNAVTTRIDPSGLWGDDVHLDLTTDWADRVRASGSWPYGGRYGQTRLQQHITATDQAIDKLVHPQSHFEHLPRQHK